MRYEELIKLFSDNKIDEIKEYIETLDQKDLNSFNFITGYNLLHDAILNNGSIELCEFIIKKLSVSTICRHAFAVFGGDFYEAHMGKTALHFAVERGSYEICELILNYLDDSHKISQILYEDNPDRGSSIANTLCPEDYNTPIELAKFYMINCELVDPIKKENYTKIFNLMKNYLDELKPDWDKERLHRKEILFLKYLNK
jgi:ankyrin repeat protein